MNPLGSEIQLMALVLALYVFDCTLLLYIDEAVLTADGRGRWRASFGARDLSIFGRAPCLLNLFTPHRRAFRLHGQAGSGGSAPGTTDWSAIPPYVPSLRPIAAGTAAGLFVVLPYSMFVAERIWPTVVAVTLIYGSILAALVVLYRHRLVAGLTGRTFTTLAFECLACPPFAVNLIRRIALHEKIAESLLAAAVRLMDPEAANQLLGRMRVAGEIERPS